MCHYHSKALIDLSRHLCSPLLQKPDDIRPTVRSNIFKYLKTRCGVSDVVAHFFCNHRTEEVEAEGLGAQGIFDCTESRSVRTTCYPASNYRNKQKPRDVMYLFLLEYYVLYLIHF